MTKEELMKLVNAGFTKDDIVNLSATKEFINEAQPEAQESKEVSSQAEEPKEEPKTDEVTADDFSALNKVNEAIDNFTKKLESFNISNAEMTHENKGDETLEDILARVLLPNGKEIN